MRLFWNEGERRLRAFWRIVLQLLMAGALGALPILLVAEPLTALRRRGHFLSHLNHDAYDRVINLIVGPLFAAGIIASVILAARWLDRRPLAHYGVVVDRSWWNNLALGFGVSAAVMLLVFVAEYLLGWIDITGTLALNVAGVSLALAFAFTVVKVVCVGLYEELVSRGYLLRNIADGTNLPTAVVASSAIFSLLHLTNDNASILSSIGLLVNGLFFASAALLTGRLSAAIGAHIGWNLFEGTVLGFPVSGDKEGASLLAIRQLGNDAITGGAFGPEAGVVGIVASVLGIGVFCALRYARETRPSMRR